MGDDKRCELVVIHDDDTDRTNGLRPHAAPTFRGKCASLDAGFQPAAVRVKKYPAAQRWSCARTLAWRVVIRPSGSATHPRRRSR